MSTTHVIPALVVPRVREGTYTRVHDLADAMVDGSRRANLDDDPSVLVKIREQLDDTWRLLDAIGWRTAEDRAAVVVYSEHMDAVLAAVEEMMPMLAQWLADLPADDPRRPEKHDEYQQTAEFADTLRSLGREQ
jgi:hypothetical protein